jgi:hypothetical protein
MQMASALGRCMLQCTQLSDFLSVVTCGLQPLLEFGDGSSVHDPATRMLVRSSAVALFARYGRCWHRV